MLKTDPIVQKYPDFLPTEEEVSLAWNLLQRPENKALLETLERHIAIGGCARSALRRFCWQAREEGARGEKCAAAAVSWVRRCAESRQRLGMDTLLEAGIFSAAFREMYHAAVPFTFHKFDRTGRPVYIIRYGSMAISDFQRLWAEGARLKEVHNLPVNATSLYHLRAMEYVARVVMGRASEKRGTVVDRMLMIMDLRDLGRRHYDASLLAFLAEVSCELRPLYPETLHATVVANVPRMVSKAAWPLARSWMRPVTRAKFTVLSSADDLLSRLRETIEFEDIPPYFGGGCTCLECRTGRLHGGSLREWEEEKGLFEPIALASGESGLAASGSDGYADGDFGAGDTGAAPDASQCASQDEGSFGTGTVAVMMVSSTIIFSASGAVAGGVTGGAVGATLGLFPAPLTFGLSIPACASAGVVAGACVGSLAGGGLGLLGGGAAGYYRQCRRPRPLLAIRDAAPAPAA